MRCTPHEAARWCLSESRGEKGERRSAPATSRRGQRDTTCGDLGTAMIFSFVTADGVFLVVVIMARRPRHAAPDAIQLFQRLPSRQTVPFARCHFVKLNVDSAAANTL